MTMTDANQIKTKFGTATINNKGYYQITSTKEGNFGKLLHRLIYEDEVGIIPDGYHIHHINKNRTDNTISNLQALPLSEHSKIHTTGKNNPMYGKHLTKEHKEKLRKAFTGKNNPRYGVKHTAEARKKMSENHADFNKENHPRWGTSKIDEWGGLWFLKQMKLQVGTMKKVEEYTGITVAMISKYLKLRGYKWSTLIEQMESA